MCAVEQNARHCGSMLLLKMAFRSSGELLTSAATVRSALHAVSGGIRRRFAWAALQQEKGGKKVRPSNNTKFQCKLLIYNYY